MKKIFVYLALLLLAAVLGFLNYGLWQLQAEKKERIEGLTTQIALHQRENHALNDRNDALRVEVDNLRSPDSYYSYEEKARENYGMIGENETYFVLPSSELVGIDDVPGLQDRPDNSAASQDIEAPPALPENTLSLESLDSFEPVPAPLQTPNDPIPVVPVPLQLESLQ